MSYNRTRLEIAAQVLSGFAANPSIFASNDRCGWSLVNCTDADIAGYAIRLADQLIDENEHMLQSAPQPIDAEGQDLRSGYRGPCRSMRRRLFRDMMRNSEHYRRRPTSKTDWEWSGLSSWTPKSVDAEGGHAHQGRKVTASGHTHDFGKPFVMRGDGVLVEQCRACDFIRPFKLHQSKLWA